MEHSIQDKFGQWTEKLEVALFGQDELLHGEDSQYFQSFFTDSYVFPRNLLTYLKKEIFLGFIFNVAIFLITVIYIPFNFENCWKCNPTITLWIIFLGTFNLILVIPKIIILPKLAKIENDPDIFVANYGLWTFFRSKLYKFNIRISKYVLCTYLLGLLLMLAYRNDEESCTGFRNILWLIIGSYFVRTTASFIKFVRNVNNHENAESLRDYMTGSSHIQIQSLQTAKYHEVAHQSDDDMCSICYENYQTDDSIRVMNCDGSHFYHKKCIDKWLLRSDKCPKCNLGAFSKRNHEKDD